MIINAFAQSTKEAVMLDTWGHMAPIPNVQYPGHIIVANGDYDITLLQYDFGAFGGGPWLYEDIGDLISQTEFQEAPAVYRFDGWYKKFKNGNCRFGGGGFRKVWGV